MASAPPVLLPRPHGLLLDAMGTLIGLQEPVGETYARLAFRHGVDVTPAQVQRGFVQAWRLAPPLAFPGLVGDALRRAEIAWWGDLIRQSLDPAATTEPPAELVAALFEHYAQPGAWRVFADVPALLERWHHRGMALAVVSNFDTRLPELLSRLGLARWLPVVVVSSEAGAAKPDPAPFRQALDRLGLPVDAVWHVGDSPEDVAGAAAAGIPCVLLQRR
ncbi:MAG: HAD-IA family hydrolase [Cyanobium sp.]|nr:HAD-IA family hydrolase [Cyanobium sp.]